MNWRHRQELLLLLTLMIVLPGPASGEWSANPRGRPEIVSDRAGGAIVTWEDARRGRPNIYAQHVLVGGAVDSTWPADGLALCPGDDTQLEQIAIADGVGGPIVAWLSFQTSISAHDWGNLGKATIIAQHVLIGGSIDSAWPARGRRLGAVIASGRDYSGRTNHRGVADGAGGGIFTWVDNDDRVGTCAQHLLASGAVDSGWAARVHALCTATGDASNPVMLSDGSGGAILAWSSQDRAVGVQHVTATGHSL